MRSFVSSGGFEHCHFCYGQGCLACPGERKKYEERVKEPLFVAKRDNPHDIELLKRYFGKEAMEHAFGSKGEGMQDVMINATIARLLQEMEKESEIDAKDVNNK